MPDFVNYLHTFSKICSIISLDFPDNLHSLVSVPTPYARVLPIMKTTLMKMLNILFLISLGISHNKNKVKSVPLATLATVMIESRVNHVQFTVFLWIKMAAFTLHFALRSLLIRFSTHIVEIRTITKQTRAMSQSFSSIHKSCKAILTVQLVVMNFLEKLLQPLKVVRIKFRIWILQTKFKPATMVIQYCQQVPLI